MKNWLRFLIIFLLSFILGGCDAIVSQVPVSRTIESVHNILEDVEEEYTKEEFDSVEDRNREEDTSEILDSEKEESDLPEDGVYSSKEDVARYLYLYDHLPSNFITKKEAEKLGWEGGSLEPFAPGMCIGGSRFGNYEGLLPEKEGRFYTECDIDTLGADKRGAKRIVFSNDGLIYYTEDHYKSFELLYGEE